MKKNMWVRLLCALTVMTVLLGAFAACGGTQKTADATTTAAGASSETAAAGTEATQAPQDEPGWKKDNSPITLDWYINYSWYSEKWGEQDTMKYITEKTGYKFNFIVPAGNEAERINTLIASNSLPDLVTLQWSDDAVKKMIEGELVLPLNKLAEQYDPHFFKVASSELLNWYKHTDGNTYAYPSFSIPPSKLTPDAKVASNQTFNVRKDMYEAIGKPDMRTPEGFLNALKAAKEKYPKVNNKPLIPFGLHEFTDNGNYSLENYIWNFLAVPLEQDGKLYDRYMDPEFLIWMKTLRKANEMGLISKDIFIDKRAQMEEKIAEGRYFSMLYQNSDFQGQNQTLYNKDPNMVYIAVDGFANSKNDSPKLLGGGITGWTLTLISKNCKNPERAIKFYTYAISEEGNRDFFLGREGVTYDMVDGKPVMKPEVLEEYKKDKNAAGLKYGRDAVWWFYDSILVEGMKPPMEDTDPYKQLREWTYGKVMAQSVYDGVWPPSDTDEGIINGKVSEKWGQLLPKLILAKSDEEFDKLVQQFKDERAALGYDNVMEFANKKFEENKKKLGGN